MTERVCLTCGTPFDGEQLILYGDCEECEEKRQFGTRDEYEYRQS